MRTMNRWVGKVAIVTGASAGIGAAICQALVEKGLQVAGFARRSEMVSAIASSLSDHSGALHAVKVDITNEEEVKEGFRWTKDNLGPVSVLINNAGILQDNTLIGGNTEKWRLVLDTNLIGLCIATREAINVMRLENIDGHIVHINSTAGHQVIPGLNMYTASKYGVTALTESLRQELNTIGSKIKISSISPGAVETDIVKTSGFQIDPETKKLIRGIFLQPKDIADAVLFTLATPPHVQVHDMIIKPVGELI